mmetsp:Transcript_14371/g.42909  ORF Transcript_14371/g.42909 Transcript_14371/m.42909 type:complete len:321 (+) Transcript_14371:259-1221(+)
MSDLTFAATGSVAPVFWRPSPSPAFQPIFSRSAKPRPDETGASFSLESESSRARGTSAPDALTASDPITCRRRVAFSASNGTTAPPPAPKTTTGPSSPSGGGGGASPDVGSHVSIPGGAGLDLSSIASGAPSSSPSETSASWSPAPQCQAVLAFMRCWSTSFSSCFAVEEPASALSMRMPAMRRWKNCCTDSPARRVSIPETAFWRHSSWSMADPASNPSSSSPSSPPPPGSSSESESEASLSPSMARFGPASCWSSDTRKEKSRAPFFASTSAAPSAAPAGAVAPPLPPPPFGMGAPDARAACRAETAGFASSPTVPSP